MQCDVFRLCWLLEVGGIYIDADQGNRGRRRGFTDTIGPWASVLREAGPRAVVCNGLMSFFEPHDPLVGAALDRACRQRRASGRPVASRTSRVRA